MKKMLFFCMLSSLLTAFEGISQDNTFDLRIAEFNDQGDITYQNFIYARSFGKLMAEVFHLRAPQADDYSELSAGFGYQVTNISSVTAYGTIHFTHATDDNYILPGLFLLDTAGRWTGSLWGVYYFPVGNAGLQQILIDPLEIQYNVLGSLSLGLSAYLWKIEDADWFTKIGLKISVADTWGASEIRCAKVNQRGGWEFLLRRIVVF